MVWDGISVLPKGSCARSLVFSVVWLGHWVATHGRDYYSSCGMLVSSSESKYLQKELVCLRPLSYKRPALCPPPMILL
jgi:hypothetical protein